LSEVQDNGTERGNDDQLKLDVKHQYYYQVQTQLGVCKIEYGYFVVWTEKDLHIEQIIFDEVLNDILSTAIAGYYPIRRCTNKRYIWIYKKPNLLKFDIVM
jgi:hypothetical protein